MDTIETDFGIYPDTWDEDFFENIKTIKGSLSINDMSGYSLKFSSLETVGGSLTIYNNSAFEISFPLLSIGKFFLTHLLID